MEWHESHPTVLTNSPKQPVNTHCILTRRAESLRFFDQESFPLFVFCCALPVQSEEMSFWCLSHFDPVMNSRILTTHTLSIPRNGALSLLYAASPQGRIVLVILLFLNRYVWENYSKRVGATPSVRMIFDIARFAIFYHQM